MEHVFKIMDETFQHLLRAPSYKPIFSLEKRTFLMRINVKNSGYNEYRL